MLRVILMMKVTMMMEVTGIMKMVMMMMMWVTMMMKVMLRRCYGSHAKAERAEEKGDQKQGGFGYLS